MLVEGAAAGWWLALKSDLHLTGKTSFAFTWVNNSRIVCMPWASVGQGLSANRKLPFEILVNQKTAGVFLLDASTAVLTLLPAGLSLHELLELMQLRPSRNKIVLLEARGFTCRHH